MNEQYNQLVKAAGAAANALSDVVSAEYTAGNHEQDDVKYLVEALDDLEAALDKCRRS